MARKVTSRRLLISTAAAWLFGFLIFLPILWMVLTSFKTELEAFAMPPTFLFFHWTTENYATVQSRSDYFHHALNSIIDCRRIDADCHADRGAGRLVDGVRADQADQGHPALDALDQDDAAGRRAGSDLSDLPGFRNARHPRRSHPDPVSRQSADRDLDAVHLFQGNSEGHPRSGADGRGDHRTRTRSMC